VKRSQAKRLVKAALMLIESDADIVPLLTEEGVERSLNILVDLKKNLVQVASELWHPSLTRNWLSLSYCVAWTNQVASVGSCCRRFNYTVR
jgi:hypothetical protein